MWLEAHMDKASTGQEPEILMFSQLPVTMAMNFPVLLTVIGTSYPLCWCLFATVNENQFMAAFLYFCFYSSCVGIDDCNFSVKEDFHKLHLL